MMCNEQGIFFSVHATVRCFQREITGKQIVAAITCGKLKRETRDILVYARGRLQVVIARKSGLVITAFRRSGEKNPKRIFRKYRRKRGKRKWGKAKADDIRRKEEALNHCRQYAVDLCMR
jgi:hypothetical protein